MTNTRSISGIDDELWKKAQEQYPNVSKKIRELLEDDLETNTDAKLPLNLIENSDLTDKQKRVAKNLVEESVSKKNSSQWNTFVEKHGIKRKDYKEKCHSAIVQSDKIPYRAEGRQGLKSIDVECRCGASSPVTLLAKEEGECPGCGRQIFDLGEKDKVEA